MGLGQALTLALTDPECRKGIGVEGGQETGQEQKIGNAAGKEHHKRGKDKAEQDAPHIPHEHPRSGHVERQEADTGCGNAKRGESKSRRAGVNLRKKSQKPESDRAGDAGNAVDAVHEVVEIGSADDEDKGKKVIGYR